MIDFELENVIRQHSSLMISPRPLVLGPYFLSGGNNSASNCRCLHYCFQFEFINRPISIAEEYHGHNSFLIWVIKNKACQKSRIYVNRKSFQTKNHWIDSLFSIVNGMPILISKSWNQDAANTGRVQIDFTSTMLHLRRDFGYLRSKLECLKLMHNPV